MPSTIQRLTADQIRDAAEVVLSSYQTERAIPVEIEEIIEFGFNMEIRPVKALQARFGFEGALTQSLSTIIIDADSSKKSINRYRFTLAHELGHRVLHGDFISSFTFEEKDDWKKTVKNIDSQTYGRLEYQAYMFAGHILVPTTALHESCREAENTALQHGIDLSEMGEGAISYIAGSIAKEYKVSTAVIQRRLDHENITFSKLQE